MASGELLAIDSRLDVTRDGCSASQCFCPHGGLIEKSSIEFRQQVQDLLRGRLRIAALLLFGALLAFLIRDYVVPGGVFEQQATSRLPHILLTIVEGLFAVFLCRRCAVSLLKLRVIEVVMFALPAVFLSWMQYAETVVLPAEDAESFGLRMLAGSIPWLLTLLIYGLFIPNGWRRATAVVFVLAIGPCTTALLVASQRPDLLSKLVESGAISANLLYMSVAGVIAVWGSHRFGTLRREAFDLRNVGVYSLIRPLGSGGMGEVFLAEHKLLKRPCAVKLIRPDRGADPRSIARFQDEVQATARLTHPNTVEIYDYGVTDNGMFFYVMEYLPGMSLEEIVDRTGPMPAGRAIHLLRQVCSALAEAHHAGMIHRDLKPGNIFAAERGGIYDFAKILDFGLVKSTDPELRDVRHTLEGFAVGSPLYAAPEVALSKGVLDARTDIYSLGATAYFLLTGRPVFAGDSAIDIMIAHRNEQPAPLSELRDGIPSDLEAVVLRCLEKSPDDRFGSVEQLDAALASCRDASRWDSEAARKWWERTSEDPTAPAGETVDAYAATTIGAAVTA